MSNIKLDDLLKEELSSFNADVPADVWQNISQQLPATPTASGGSTQYITGKVAAKSVFVTVKGALITAGVATVLGVVVWRYTKTEQDQSKEIMVQQDKSEAMLQTEQSITQPTIETPVQGETNTIHSTQKRQPAVAVAKNNQKQVLPQAEHGVAVNNNHNNQTQSTDLVLSDKGNKHTLDANPTAKQVNPEVETSTPALAQSTHSTQPNSEGEMNKIFIPDVITPNGDGKNDELVIDIENEVLFDLKITDKQGNLVFESKTKQPFWNGTHQNNGNACLPGLYVLVLRYQTKLMTEAKVETRKIWVKL